MTSYKITRRGTPLDQDAGYLRQLIAESALIERKAHAIAEEIRSEFTSGFIVDFNDLPLEDRQMFLAPLQAAETLCGELDTLRDQLCERFNALVEGEPEPQPTPTPGTKVNNPAAPNADVLGYAIRFPDGTWMEDAYNSDEPERMQIAVFVNRADAMFAVGDCGFNDAAIVPVPLPASLHD